MWNLLQIELYKIFKRPRTYIAFGAIAAIVLLMQLGLKYDGKAYVDLLFSNIDKTFDISDYLKERMLNGYLISFVILNTLLIQMPLLVALVAGDSIAGEANMGTLRLAMTRPISRTQYMLVKFMASAIYTVLLLIWMAILALFLSMWLFDTSDMVILRSTGIEIIAESDIFWRYLCAFGYAAVALTTVASLAFLFSVFAENSIGPIIATMSVVIVFTILSEMNIPIYDSTVKPYLFTSHMLAWKGFFYVQATPDGTSIRGSIENLPGILKSMSILLVYMAVFVSSAIYIFRRKDILS
ncbi:MAG: ABC transporter permease [Chitinophagaceae bacterium]